MVRFGLLTDERVAVQPIEIPENEPGLDSLLPLDEDDSIRPEAAHFEFFRRSRRFAVVASVGICFLAALFARRHLAWCGVGVGPFDENTPFISLVETFPQDLVDLDQNRSRDLLSHWLAVANTLDENSSALGSDPKHVEEVLKEALNTKDPEKASKIVQRAANRAVGKMREKRQKFKDIVQTKGEALKSVGHRDWFFSSNQPKSVGQKTAMATCVFDVLQASTMLGQTAADINDASKTCETVDAGSMFVGKTVHQKVCGLNVFAAVSAVAGIAALLSVAANDCASTLVPSMDALCASSVSGYLMVLSRMGGAAALTSAACSPEHSWYGQISKDLKPSNLGSDEILHLRGETSVRAKDIGYQWPFHNLRAAQDPPSPADLQSPGPSDELAQPRRLLFGGGKGSMETQCGLDVANIGWGFAWFALTIDSMVNKAHGASCPPRNLAGGQAIKGLWYNVMQSYCTVDIFGIISYLAQVVGYTSLAVVACADELNLPAMCTGGIDGLIGSLGGLGQVAAGAHLACDTFQDPALKRVIALGKTMDKLTNGAVSRWYGSGMGGTNFEPLNPSKILGRRLLSDGTFDELRRDIEEVKKRFASPEEAWASVGFNLTDVTADFRQKTPRGINTKNLAELVEEPVQTGGIFSKHPTCH